jgi:hypothetical protein
MHGEEWLVVKLTMDANPNTFASSSCIAGSEAAAELFDVDVFFFPAVDELVSSFESRSVESTVPIVLFSMIKSAN